jgi:hypothetical protein
MEIARREQRDMTNVATAAVTLAGYELAARFTWDALLRNLKIAEGYQCLDAAGETNSIPVLTESGDQHPIKTRAGKLLP